MRFLQACQDVGRDERGEDPLALARNKTVHFLKSEGPLLEIFFSLDIAPCAHARDCEQSQRAHERLLDEANAEADSNEDDESYRRSLGIVNGPVGGTCLEET